MTHQGIFGCWLIIAGNLIRGLAVKNVTAYSNRTAFRFGKVIRVAIILICLAHFPANIYETVSLLGNNGFTQAATMIASVLIGRVLGGILFKIVK